MKKKLNIDELIWFFILLGFTYYFYMIISSDKILLFIHPKMIKYVKFGLGFFCVLTIFQVKNIFSLKRGKKSKLAFFMFLIPLILGMFLKPTGLNADAHVNKVLYMPTKKECKLKVIERHEHNHKNSNEICNDVNIDFKAEDTNIICNKNINIENELSKSKVIELTDDNFMIRYEKLYSDTKSYEDKKLIMSGFIYSPKDKNQNEIAIARLLLSCCASDTQLVGFYCETKTPCVYKAGTWVNVYGTISSKEYREKKGIRIIPIIKIEKIEEMEKPKDQYIYN